jgi:hypothetical protein
MCVVSCNLFYTPDGLPATFSTSRGFFDGKFGLPATFFVPGNDDLKLIGNSEDANATELSTH